MKKCWKTNNMAFFFSYILNFFIYAFAITFILKKTTHLNGTGIIVGNELLLSITLVSFLFFVDSYLEFLPLYILGHGSNKEYLGAFIIVFYLVRYIPLVIGIIGIVTLVGRLAKDTGE
ncbi:hypothetical protein D7Z94_23840 [Ulvibacterium marinum]|uniref:Uncharacterized protein n=1 Tax=Ulvibacterium marinum TaxID=2419782 RepID=A0A3B0BYB8_9FLAO|nr:hypothetical protein D7Z94_23840 [Ulvibacterium marinum]